MSATVQQSCTLTPGIPKSAADPDGLAMPAPAPDPGQALAEAPAEAPVLPSIPALDLEGRVPKELVHFRDQESVLVTGWVRRSPTEFTLAVEWPGSTSGTRPDPVLAAQTVRQCGLAISHAEFGVPLDHQSLLRDLNYSIDPTVPKAGNGPLRLTVDLRCSPVKKGRGDCALGAETMDFTVRQGRHTVIRAHSRSSWISPGVYSRLRGEYVSPAWGEWEVPPPVPAASVGCLSASEVVLAAGDRPGSWLLRNDVENKAMFDHPVDHVPGLALLAAAGQAAQAAVSPGILVPTGVTTSYSRYVEFDAPCRLEALVLPTDAPGHTAVEVIGVQNGEAAFRIGLRGLLR
ncbi:ScbA/BarX family gamma-butyrolactone biosynthesis protein [Streptomyces sp. NPDC026206]|uniref:ScbA/BarX family gamma-butyrolactone biosynthesis protein n=1 Tax=Streptomyces sp. NPDC026206 TaxID=3157089 RepID=UPI0033C7AEE1